MLTGYRTIIFNVVMGAILLFRAFAPDAEVPSDAEVGGWIDTLLAHADAIITVVGNVYLRFKTATAVFSKE